MCWSVRCFPRTRTRRAWYSLPCACVSYTSPSDGIAPLACVPLQFDQILTAYHATKKDSTKVIQKLHAVRLRGRKRSMVG
jgi:hypothetical protein